MGDAIWVTTDGAGFVLDCSPAALDLIGYTARGVRGRELAHMFVRGRPTLSELLQAGVGSPVEREAEFRPYERKALRVLLRITACEGPGERGRLLWTFSVRWPVGMRIPAGVDRRQLITIWRTAEHRCIFAPGGSGNRRLLLCGPNDEVIYEEPVASAAEAFARAADLRNLHLSGGPLPSLQPPPAPSSRTDPPAGL